jgi:peroxygenase
MCQNFFEQKPLAAKVKGAFLLSCVCMTQALSGQNIQNHAAVLASSATEEVAVIADFNRDGQEDAILAVPTHGLAAEAVNKRDDIALYVFWGKAQGVPEVKDLPSPLSVPSPLSEPSNGQDWKLLAQDFDQDGISDFLLATESRQGERKMQELWFYRGTPHGFSKPILTKREEQEEFDAIFRKAIGASPVADTNLRSKDTLRDLERLSCPVEPFIPWDQMNALQKHLSFFDKDGDGKVTLKENFQSLRDLGIHPALALPFAIAINGAMATPTAGYPTFTLYLPRIDAGMHGSDSGLYDNEGRFDRQKFERWFTVWDKNSDGALDVRELAQRLFQEADLFDLFGSVASGGEFAALFLVAAEQGKLSKSRMQELYEGGLFYAVAAARGSLGCRINFAEN